VDDEQRPSTSESDLSGYGLFRALSAEERDRGVLALLKRLFELEQHTSPAGGEKTVIGKDAHASEALAIAGLLVQAVAGWALNHQYGLALQGLDPAPPQPAKTGKRGGDQEERANSEYVKKRALVDSHEHERAGAAASRKPISDPVVARRLLINLLSANPGGFDPAIQEAAVEALRELRYGETLPLLRPERWYKKRGYRELRLQLRALGFVEYKVALGDARNAAQDAVSDAFGVSSDTLRTWEKRLPAEFGHLELEHARSLARKATNRNHVFGRFSLADLGAFYRYEDEALRVAGREYRNLLGFSSGC
jgi:hypothetical protein